MHIFSIPSLQTLQIFQKIADFPQFSDKKRQKLLFSFIFLLSSPFLFVLLPSVVKWTFFVKRIEVETFYQPKYDRDIHEKECTNQLLKEFYGEFGRVDAKDKIRLKSRRWVFVGVGVFDIGYYVLTMSTMFWLLFVGI
jgi:hypothetical protein